MNRIDLIIDALYKTKLLMDAHGQYPHTLREVNEALAAAHELRELKPVAWMLTLPDGTHDWILDGQDCDGYVPLYVAPLRKEWVGLTDDELWDDFYRVIESKLKKKNK